MKDYLTLSRASDLPRWQDRWLYRAFEMLPGILAWSTLGGVVVFSFIAPVAMAIFIIVFDTYWLIKTVYLSFHLRVAFNQVKVNMVAPWFDELQKLDPAGYQLASITSWEQIYHLVMLPTYKEGLEIIESTLDGLIKANYPKDKMIVVLAQEYRAGTQMNNRYAAQLQEKYGASFFKLVFVEHPDTIVGELAGKGSNIAWAGKFAKREIIDRLEIPYEHVLVSALDIDTIVMPEYFSRLTHAYLTTKDPLRASYQPVPFYINNIWDAPAFARISAFSTTFWQTVKQEQSESMITYSSHSMPFQALVDVGFWQTNMVSEDSRIFWQCLLHYDGNYRVEPLYYPVSMDANLSDTYVQTMVSIYKQQRRWGYGSENVPYFLYGFLRTKAMPFKKKFFYSFVMIEGVWSWATNSIMLFLLGWLPVVVGGAAFNTTVLSFNLPYFTRFMMTFAMFGLITSATMSLFVLPVRPDRHGKFRHASMVLQWILFPLKSIFFGAVPALEAQTRLMLGKYMGFWVTPKSRAIEAKAEISPNPSIS